MIDPKSRSYDRKNTTIMKLTKTQKERIIHHALELFKTNTGKWVKNNSIGKVAISPSGGMYYKNIFTQGVDREQLPTDTQLKLYVKESLNWEVDTSVLLMRSYEDDGIDLALSIFDDNGWFEHREKVIEFKDRIVHKVLA